MKRSELLNHGTGAATVRVLDGVQNLMPYGISRELQTTRSVLADAYKKNELVPDTTLGLFTLSAIPVDKAEPSEALKATTVWSAGLEPDALLLSTRQLDRFRAGHAVETETAVRAERGAYFVAATLDLAAGAVPALGPGRRHRAGRGRRDRPRRCAGRPRDACWPTSTPTWLRARSGSASSWPGPTASSVTAEPMTTARHRMNVLFNIMRGGVFDEGYSIVREDVRAFVAHHNAAVAEAHADRFDALPERVTFQALHGDGEQPAARSSSGSARPTSRSASAAATATRAGRGTTSPST